LGDSKGIRPVKKLDVGGDDLAGALHDLQLQLSSCHRHLHRPLLQKAPADPGSFGK